MRGRVERGQASVELALVLPIVAFVALALLDLGLVLRDNVLCAHAAREAARALAVGEDPVAAARRRSGLGDALLVRVDASTGTATVELELSKRLTVVGRMLPGASLIQSASMRIETMASWPARAPPGLSPGRREEVRARTACRAVRCRCRTSVIAHMRGSRSCTGSWRARRVLHQGAQHLR